MTISRLGSGETLVLGRGDGASVRIDDPRLSRLHARFERDGAGVSVTDLGSRNGTFVQNSRVDAARLRPTENVVCGDVTVSVQVAPAGGASQYSVSAPTVSDEELAHQTSAPAAMIRVSSATEQVERLVEQVAPGRIPVLVLGETGTGKELVARDLHRRSPRGARPLTVVNCATIPNNLVESVLFGHVRGAFTGADRPRKGLFEQASGSTLFLDEVGELSASAQAALLRVLDSGRICPVGAQREIEVDVRLIAATHRDLESMVSEGSFRLDLLHRLNTVTIQLPPLRERREEIAPLAEHFLRTSSAQWGGRVCAISAEALLLLESYDWPGNIRELKNVIERGLALAKGELLTPDELPAHLRDPARGTSPFADATGGPEHELDFRTQIVQRELDLIRAALEKTNGHQRRAAALLKLPLRTFERKLQRLGGSIAVERPV